MPADPIVSAIVSSIISSVAEGMLTAPPSPPDTGLVRVLPEEAKKGTMTKSNPAQVTIDGTTYPLSPGIQIRNDLNMLIMPAMLSGSARVRYQVDFAGHVHRLWILSATEARLPENR